MTKNPNQPAKLKPATNNIDSFAGAGVGIWLASLAQDLPDNHTYKSWLIRLAPAIGMLIRYLWNLIIPEVSFYIRSWLTEFSRKRMFRKAEKVLSNPGISEENKARVRAKMEEAQLSIIEELFQHIDKTMSSD